MSQQDRASTDRVAQQLAQKWRLDKRLDTDPTLSGQSHDRVPSQKAVKEYVDYRDSLLLAQLRGFTRVVVVGDSQEATNAMTEPGWPDVLAVRMGALNAPVEMHNLSKNGWTYNKANTVAAFDTLTMIQQAIALNPAAVIVAMGANDATLNIEGRTLTQVKADAATAFSALRAGLPSAVIIYGSELMFDDANFPTPGTTLKNKGTTPFLWQLKSAGILTGLISSECLDDSVAAGTLTNFGNWVQLDTYVKALGTVDDSFTLPYFKACRLGLVGVDKVHPNALGSLFLASAFITAAPSIPELVVLFPRMMSQEYWPWNDPDQVFDNFLTASGDGWVTAAYDPQTAQMSKHAGLWSRVNPDVWFYPSKAVGKTFPLSYTADGFSVPYWTVTNATPNTSVDISTNGAAFAAGGQTTDAYGCAHYPAIAGNVPAATYTFRYKVGDEVYGPFVVTVTAPAEPHAVHQQAGNQATGPSGWYQPAFGTAVENTGVTWAAGVATITRAGRYMVASQIALDAVPAASYIVASIYVNGARSYDGEVSTNGTGGAAAIGASVGLPLRFAVGDTVTAQVFTGGVCGNISPGAGAGTWFSLSWLGY